MDDNKRYMYDVDRAVRFVDVTEHNVGFGGETLWVFVRNACAELRYIGHLYGRIFTYDRKTPDELHGIFHTARYPGRIRIT